MPVAVVRNFECQIQVLRIKRLFRLLLDLPTLFAAWEPLVGAYSCHGHMSFDLPDKIIRALPDAPDSTDG
ncbi:MAG: hypothetical protein ACLQIB_19465 [Isosphaeraceae bacterium]